MPQWVFGALDLGLIFAPVLAFALWELYSLRRERRRDAAKRAADAGPSVFPTLIESGGIPIRREH